MNNMPLADTQNASVNTKKSDLGCDVVVHCACLLDSITSRQLVKKEEKKKKEQKLAASLDSNIPYTP